METTFVETTPWGYESGFRRDDGGAHRASVQLICLVGRRPHIPTSRSSLGGGMGSSVVRDQPLSGIG